MRAHDPKRGFYLFDAIFEKHFIVKAEIELIGSLLSSDTTCHPQVAIGSEGNITQSWKICFNNLSSAQKQQAIDMCWQILNKMITEYAKPENIQTICQQLSAFNCPLHLNDEALYILACHNISMARKILPIWLNKSSEAQLKIWYLFTHHKIYFPFLSQSPLKFCFGTVIAHEFDEQLLNISKVDKEELSPVIQNIVCQLLTENSPKHPVFMPENYHQCLDYWCKMPLAKIKNAFANTYSIEPIATEHDAHFKQYSIDTIQMVLLGLLHKQNEYDFIQNTYDAFTQEISNLNEDECIWLYLSMFLGSPLARFSITKDQFIEQPQNTSSALTLLAKSLLSKQNWQLINQQLNERKNCAQRAIIITTAAIGTLLSKKFTDENLKWLSVAINTQEYPDFFVSAQGNNSSPNQTALHLTYDSPAIRHLIYISHFTQTSKDIVQKAIEIAGHNKEAFNTQSYVNFYIEQELKKLTPDTLIHLHLALKGNIRFTNIIKITGVFVPKLDERQHEHVQHVIQKIYRRLSLGADYLEVLEKHIDTKKLSAINQFILQYTRAIIDNSNNIASFSLTPKDFNQQTPNEKLQWQKLYWLCQFNANTLDTIPTLAHHFSNEHFLFCIDDIKLKQCFYHLVDTPAKQWLWGQCLLHLSESAKNWLKNAFIGGSFDTNLFFSRTQAEQTLSAEQSLDAHVLPLAILLCLANPSFAQELCQVPALSSIHKLELDNLPFGDQGIRCLAQLMQQRRKELQSLSFNYCNVSSAIVTCYHKLWRPLMLQPLSFENNPISPAEWRDFGSIVINNGLFASDVSLAHMLMGSIRCDELWGLILFVANAETNIDIDTTLKHAYLPTTCSAVEIARAQLLLQLARKHSIINAGVAFFNLKKELPHLAYCQAVLMAISLNDQSALFSLLKELSDSFFECGYEDCNQKLNQLLKNGHIELPLPDSEEFKSLFADNEDNTDCEQIWLMIALILCLSPTYRPESHSRINFHQPASRLTFNQELSPMIKQLFAKALLHSDKVATLVIEHHQCCEKTILTSTKAHQLIIQNITLDSGEIDILAHALAENFNITCLRINYSITKSDELAQLIYQLHSSGLAQLHIEHHDPIINRRIVDKICSLLKNDDCTIEELSIKGNCIKAEELKILCEQLLKHKLYLKQLHIEVEGIDHRSSIALARYREACGKHFAPNEALPHSQVLCQQFQRLDMDDVNKTDDPEDQGHRLTLH